MLQKSSLANHYTHHFKHSILDSSQRALTLICASILQDFLIRPFEKFLALLVAQECFSSSKSSLCEYSLKRVLSTTFIFHVIQV